MKKESEKAKMVRKEAKETRAEEKKESKAYQAKEKRMGVEKHKH